MKRFLALLLTLSVLLPALGIPAAADEAASSSTGSSCAVSDSDLAPKEIKQRDLSAVQAAAQEAIDGYNGTWSVYLSDVTTGASFSLNDRRMSSASVIKLYVMGAVMEALNNGTLEDSDTIESYLYSMITVSSNRSWKKLASILGNGNYSRGMQVVTQ